MGTRNIWIIVIAGLLVITGCIIPYYITFHSFGVSTSNEHWGTFGDYIGGVLGTVFNFAGVILIYLTFSEQQRTTIQMFREQQDQDILTHFEDTFFNMLSVQRDLFKSLIFTIRREGAPNEVYEGIMFLGKFTRELQIVMDEVDLSGSVKAIQQAIREKYLEAIAKQGATLDPHFRFLNHFLRYVEESDIFPPEKKKYTDIIQAQMSGIELYAFFYHVTAHWDEPHINMLERVGFFEYMDSASLAFDKQKRLFFPISNFKYNTEEITMGMV